MGLRGPKPGTMKERPRDSHGHFAPIVVPLKSWSVPVVLAAIERNFGLKTQVARELGAHLETIMRYGREIEAIRQAFWAQNERINDLAELGLFGAIQRGEPWAICFRLKTKAKDRGYIERDLPEAFIQQNTLVQILKLAEPVNGNTTDHKADPGS